MTPTRRIVLVGAGHAHLHVAAHARPLARRGATVTLIDPGQFWYSGRATAMLGARCDAAADRIDPRPVVEAGGGRFVADRVTSVNRHSRELQLASGDTIAYSVLSLNIGSTVRCDLAGATGDDPDIWPVKPIGGLWDLRLALQSRLNRGEHLTIAVIGGGPTGCEISANLVALARQCSGTVALTLIQRDARLASALPRPASRRLHAWLKENGVTVMTRRTVARREPGVLVLDDGQHMPVDTIVLATGLVAPPWLDKLDLPTDDGVLVDASLQSVTDRHIFAAGDCAHLSGHDLPRLGVFGVRQAPVLLMNLAAALDGKPLQAYQPQSRWLSILDLGDGTALATRGRHWWHGRASRWLKAWLDQRFLDSYR